MDNKLAAEYLSRKIPKRKLKMKRMNANDFNEPGNALYINKLHNYY
jgi:hypothetical protein